MRRITFYLTSNVHGIHWQQPETFFAAVASTTINPLASISGLDVPNALHKWLRTSKSWRSCSSCSDAGDQQQSEPHAASGPPATMSEQQLSELFDNELEQRLINVAATAAAARVSAGSSTRPQQQQPEQLIDDGLSGGMQPSTTNAAHKQQPLQQQALQQRQWQQPSVLPMERGRPQFESPSQPSAAAAAAAGTGPPRVASWHPLLSTDPWAPLPGPALARRHLPAQLMQLLQKAGVQAGAAEEALRQAAADVPGSSSSSSSSSLRPLHTTGRRRRPFSPSSIQRQPPQRQPPQQQPRQQQRPDYSSVLSRLQLKQLTSLLEDCSAPTFGDKQLLVRRLVLLLQEQQSIQQQQQQQQQHQEVEAVFSLSAAAAMPEEQQQQQNLGSGVDKGIPKGAGAAGAAGSAAPAAHTDGPANRITPAANTLLQQPKQQQQQQQQRRQQQQRDSPHRSRVLAATAARRAVLDAVLDVGQVCSWLMAARAQDVCHVDVRGRAGLQQQLVIATGLNQRHAHACAEAVAWQLREAARELVLQQQQQQQQQQQPQDSQRQQQQQQQPEQQCEEDASLDAAASEEAIVGMLLSQARAAAAQQEGGTNKLQWQQQQQQQQVAGATIAAAGNCRAQDQSRELSLQEQLPALNVLGDQAADWAVLDAGSVVVHVLTERARRFYNLEGLWGGRHGQHITWVQPEQLVETKDTIGRTL